MTDGYDPGQPNERTGLAWQRTSLAGLACGILVARLLAEVSAALALGVGLTTLLVAAALGGLSLRRVRRNQSAIGLGRAIGDGRPYALLTVLMVMICAGGLRYVVSA